MDNITAPAIGIRLATDEIGGVHYPVGKMAHGGPDQATPVTADTPFPTTDTAVLAALGDVLDKLIAAPSTAAGQASLLTAVNALATLLGGTLAVSATALPLPAGAATGGKQDTGNTTLASILAALGTTLAVSAVSLPLPTGAATSAAQTTMSTTLANILTALGATLKVQTPIPTGVVTGQVPLTANTTAQLPSVPLVNGIVIKAAATKVAQDFPVD
mgnify:CR=1 FL=1